MPIPDGLRNMRFRSGSVDLRAYLAHDGETCEASHQACKTGQKQKAPHLVDLSEGNQYSQQRQRGSKNSTDPSADRVGSKLVTVLYGVHAGTEDVDSATLIAFWTRVEELGFGWISCWDHFVGIVQGDGPFEAVATHAALASHTKVVRVGVLVYAMGYRHPAVLASAVATVDHLSDGRADLGIGAGWEAGDYGAFGIEFPGTSERLDKLEEGVQVLNLLLHNGGGSMAGEHYTLTEAELPVPPVQERLPIWIGGVGEKRVIPMAGRLADGWDAPLGLSSEEFAHKVKVLTRSAEQADRDPSSIRRSAHIAIYENAHQAADLLGEDLAEIENGVLIGSDDYILEEIKRYEEAGATQILFSTNASHGTDNLERAARLLRLN